MSASAPELLVEAGTEFLQRFSPFNRMEPEALAFLAASLRLAFYAKGNEILTPEMGQPRFFHIVQRGKVQARQSGAAAVTEYATIPIGPGECFPIGAISARRPSTNTYIAVEDSFVYQLAADDFVELMQMSPVFHLFCTRYIASLLNQSRQQLQSAFAQRAAEQQAMTTALGKLLKHEPVTVTPDTTTRSALEKMAERHIGCIVIVDGDHRPVGILTQSDLLPRVVLSGFDLARPIREVMTSTPRVIAESASAYDAVLEMATHGLRHLMVIDNQGRLKGVVSERDLFSLQRISVRQIRASIEAAGDVDTLRRASQDIHQLALNLIAQGIAAEQLTQFISALNDALTRRIITIELDRHQLRDVEYAWLAFGSEGRHEQTLSTDQDNGLIFSCAAQTDKEALRQRLVAFAASVNRSLAACGFPLCKGNIMASNPQLCLTLDEWQRRFSSWINEPDPQALLNASIFFDYRVLSGNEQLGDRLRDWLNRTARKNSTFLRMMAANALQVAPPLGRIRDFVLDDDGTIDLKTAGARLFVDAARILALRAEVASSSTVQRLRQAAPRIGIRADELSAIIDGFHFIQLLRLRAQHLDDQHGTPGDNKIKPDELNELDRRILKEAFRQARKLQLRLKLDYQL
jgi:CBS domain-containing protein